MVGPIVDRYPTPVGPVSLHLRRSRLALVLGLRVPDAEVERILRALALTPSAASDGWDVAVPTFRVDLTREVDLIEEVGRLYGFDRIEPTFPALTMPAPPADPRIARDELVRRILTSCGFSEAVTFGFIEAAAARAFETNKSDGGDGLSVPLQNPLSAKFDVLRPSLVPGLVDAVAHNRRHGRTNVQLFEIGSRFSRCSSETRGVGFAWTGSPVPLHWSGGARELDFFDAKGVVEQLSQALGISARFLPQAPAFLSPGQSATVAVGDTAVGVVGLVMPALSESRGAPRHDKIFVAEIDLDRVWTLREPSEERAQPLPRHPFVVRDISIIVNDSLPAEIIRGTIQAAVRGGTAPLVATEFFDRYKGKGVPENAISLSARLTFQASDRTLTDSEVQQSVETVVRALGREHGAVQR
jgi:phenylalanyl-tRNA synthetase beta chain